MRPKFVTRTIYLRTGVQQQGLLSLIVNLPLDNENPLEVVIREKVKARNNDQNALLWAALNEIAAQAWVNGRQFSADVWHEHAKREFLPEQHEEGITREGYQKWDYLPNGERVLVGSTTQLTTKGFADYVEQVFSLGAGMGTQFRVAA